jgi:hypothetical protein
MPATEQPCPGTCNRAWRQALAIYEAELAEYNTQPGQPGKPPEKPEIRPWYGNPWCHRCQSAIREDLTQLPDLAAQLAMRPPGVKPVATAERVKVSGSREQPSPSPAGDDIDELARWLNAWHAVLLDDDDVIPRYSDEAEAIRKHTAVLYHSFSPLITSPAGQEFGSQIRSWHRRLENAVHEGTFLRFVPIMCPGCKRYALWERPGEEYVVCRYCPARPSRSELGMSAA